VIRTAGTDAGRVPEAAAAAIGVPAEAPNDACISRMSEEQITMGVQA
jgi:hypothetical protein